MVRIVRCTFVVTLLAALATPVFAQATRTWVSGVGDDANPCSRTAPCKTFAGAISKTAAGGEINAIDSGGFGTLTITKGITIDGQGTQASILANLVNGIVVNATASDVVTLRNLSLNGINTGPNGIRYLGGKALILENVTIEGFNNGIDINLNSWGQITLRNVTISRCALIGLRSSTASNSVMVSLENVTMKNCPTGIFASNGSRLTLKNCDLSLNTTGLQIESPAISSRAMLESCIITNTTTGITAGPGAPLVRLADCTISNNANGLVSTGGTFGSAGNNRIIGNTSDGVVPTPFTLK